MQLSLSMSLRCLATKLAAFFALCHKRGKSLPATQSNFKVKTKDAAFGLWKLHERTQTTDRCTEDTETVALYGFVK